MNENNIPDELVALVQALGEDDVLYRWFQSLTGLAANLRHSEIGRMTARLRTDGEPALAEALSHLNNEALVVAVARATERLREK